MTTTPTEVAIVSSNTGARADIEALRNGGAAVFSTMTGEDRGAKVAILKALTNSKPVKENLNKKFNLLNVVIQAVEIRDEQGKDALNEETGELEKPIITVKRIILVDDKNEAWHAISDGLFKSLETIFGVMGNPDTWEGVPLPIKVIEAGTGVRKYFTVQITA